MEDRIFGRRYRVTEKIGTGGMADVYKAVDETLGRTVAVKVLHRQYASDPAFVARFRQEAQAAANLSHPTIVNIYDWGKEDDTYYIIMEYVRGRDLKSLVDEKGPVDPMKAARYAEQVCKALAVAHGYDIIHRDIKPQNIVLMPDGQIKVMDFGIARAGNTTMTQTGSVLGTAHYLSPEQAQGRPLTPASDLYSLGVVLFELTTGKLPFTADDPVAVALKHVNEAPRLPRQINPSIPTALENIIMRAMSNDPNKRYASAEEMRADLDRYLAGHAVAAPMGAPGAPMDHTSVIPTVGSGARGASDSTMARAPRIAKQRSKWPIVVALIIAALIVGGIAASAAGWFGAGTVQVPDITQRTPDQAQAILAGAGLTLGDVSKRSDDTAKSGTILEQSPIAGAKVAKGTKVAIVLSAGIAKIEVPDVVGDTQDDALLALQDAGFRVQTKTENSDTVPEGQVISQTPAAVTSADKGSTVTITVSAGQKTAFVPNVVGSSQGKATSAIKAVGLKTQVVEEYSETIKKGVVIRQDPGAGVAVGVGGTVTLTVSKGSEKITVPGVIGKTESDAKSELEALGLVVTVDYATSPDDGIVLTQNPLPEAIARRGDTINLIVGKAPAGP